MPGILLIINPNSSKGNGKKKAEKIKAVFKEKGIDLDVSYTEKKGHAEKLSFDAAVSGKYETVIACGGDGSVNEVINGIMKSGKDVKMGIIPIGRGNDIAWNYGIKSADDAIAKILNSRGKRVDVGIVKGGNYPEGRYFLNGNGYGFEPLVTFLAMDFKHVNGIISYILAFISIMINPPKPYSVTIKTEEKVRDVETQQISISIGRRMGSTFILAPNAVVDDGYFELMYTVHPFTRFSLLSAVFRFLRGTHLKCKKDFESYRTKSVEIISKRGVLSSHVDGEVISRDDGKDFSISIIEKGVFVFQ